jgi:hypothetical protein
MPICRACFEKQEVEWCDCETPKNDKQLANAIASRLKEGYRPDKHCIHVCPKKIWLYDSKPIEVCLLDDEITSPLPIHVLCRVPSNSIKEIQFNVGDKKGM